MLHRQPGPADEAPDNSRKIADWQERKLLKMNMTRGSIPEWQPRSPAASADCEKCRKYLIRFEKPVSSITPIELSEKHEGDGVSRRSPAEGIGAFHGALPAPDRSAHLRLLRGSQRHPVVLPFPAAADDAHPVRLSFAGDVRSSGESVARLSSDRPGIRDPQSECAGRRASSRAGLFAGRCC